MILGASAQSFGPRKEAPMARQLISLYINRITFTMTPLAACSKLEVTWGAGPGAVRLRA